MDECRAGRDDPAAFEACLDRWLEASSEAMNEALGRARGTAQGIDQRTGRDAAVLGVEASQQAWQAYRDAACETWAVFVGGADEADAVELACRIEQTDERTELLLDLAAVRTLR